MMAKTSLPHGTYWQERMDEIFRYADRQDIDIFRELADVYLDSAQAIQKELYAFYFVLG